MLTYKEFEHYMTDVVNHVTLAEKVDDLCREYRTERYITYPELDYDVVMLLEKLMDDKNEWIDYWVFELHCGEQYRDGCVTDKDGTNIPLKTIRDVYDLLTKKS